MSKTKQLTSVVIMGAAGRDFHNYNMVFRDDRSSRVVAFTATQIPEIAGRRYPPALAGPHYPQGIPIVDEADLATVCREQRVAQVVFAYSDVSYARVMHTGSVALAAGADFVLLGPERTMLHASVPVVATSAVRTGCGKSQITRWLSRLLKQRGLNVGVIRHPMPYGDLERQAVQRFADRVDLDTAACTVEEREEYEPHLELGNIVYAGVDYAAIVALAERDCDVILWDGGNNDFPFIRPDLHIVLVDPLRAGDESTHHPGEAVLRMADIVVIAKTNSAADADVQQVSENAHRINPQAVIVRGTSPVQLDAPDQVRGARVLVVEDGPTITHGGMPYGAGFVAATQAQAKEIIDPRDGAVDEIAAVYDQYPHIGSVLPAVGYNPAQLQALQDTINATPAEVVVTATPCDLGALIRIDKPVVRARYEYADAAEPGLKGLVTDFLDERNLMSPLR
jgi:predicted GTPase